MRCMSSTTACVQTEAGGRKHQPPTLTSLSQTCTNLTSNKRTPQDLQYAYVLAVNVIDVVVYTAAMVGAHTHHVRANIHFRMHIELRVLRESRNSCSWRRVTCKRASREIRVWVLLHTACMQTSLGTAFSARRELLGANRVRSAQPKGVARCHGRGVMTHFIAVKLGEVGPREGNILSPFLSSSSVSWAAHEFPSVDHWVQRQQELS